MNIYCRNCGEKLENDAEICPKCNAEVFKNKINIAQKEKELEEYKNKENKYIIIIIASYALAYILNTSFLYFLGMIFSPLLYLGATITLIYARITMNKSKKIRIMFNIFIGLIFLYLLFIVFLIITCTGRNKGC